jgi:uncharacterized protein YoaH (UPF0181 family)
MKLDQNQQACSAFAVPLLLTSYRTSRTTHQVDRSSVMRSDQIHRSLAQGMNRFEVCQLVAKGVKATHKTGARFEDSSVLSLKYATQDWLSF